MSERRQTILIIDDESRLLHVLGMILRDAGYAVREANSGRTGLLEAARAAPDLVILDLAMPDMSGAAVVTEIRLWSRKPILMLSASESPADKVRALDAGADDYITKPFNPDELLARVRAMLRRIAVAADEARFVSGDMALDYAHRTLTVAGREIPLTRTEFSLLALLARNAGKLLSHERILLEVRGANAEAQRQYLRVYVSTLRKKMTVPGAAVPQIETRPSVGYRLVAE